MYRISTHAIRSTRLLAFRGLTPYSPRAVTDDLTMKIDITVGFNRNVGYNLLAYPKLPQITFADKKRLEWAEKKAYPVVNTGVYLHTSASSLII